MEEFKMIFFVIAIRLLVILYGVITMMMIYGDNNNDRD